MEYEEFVRKLGEKIKDIRISKGITQESMDEGEYKISYRTLQDIENGQSHPSIRSLFKISKRLGVEPQNLLVFENSKAKRRNKVTEKELQTLHSYFKNAIYTKNLVYERVYVVKKFEKDEILLYLKLWFSFLYLVVNAAIFKLEIKEKPFLDLYDFKLNKWTNEYLEKLRDSNLLIGTFQSDKKFTMKSEELESLLAFAGYLHSLIAIFFKEDDNLKIPSLKNLNF